MQMYKVFVNDCLIILTENKNISTHLTKINFEEVNISELISDLFNNKKIGICLICSNLKFCWKQFSTHFKIQKAAGGKVLNAKNETLFIERFNKWDLPKGKLEKFETIENCAIREVQEECGIDSLIIENQLETTYHIFERNGAHILKITYWFKMKTDFIGNLTPQIEEGVQQALFKNEKETSEALKNTYENIKLLF
jgi:ADP-ribose pyrophosphatase YjhB (NUDIX family)